MAGSALVDVAIGIVLLYLIVALFCTAIQEWIAQLSNLRAKHLQAAITVLLSGSKTPNSDADAVLQHPLIKMLAVDRGKLLGAKDPSYVPARNFTDALVAKLVPSGTLDMAGLKHGVTLLANADVKRTLAALLNRAEASQATPDDQLKAALTGIESWYDSAMDHASGWYKRRVRWILLAIALVVSVWANADSIQVGLLLSADAQLRDSVTALAAKTAPADAQTPQALVDLGKQATAQLTDRNIRGGFGALPVGWDVCRNSEKTIVFSQCYPSTWNFSATEALLYKSLGLLLTAVAAALGAPFWFGLLQQFNAIRAAGPRPASKTGGDAGS